MHQEKIFMKTKRTSTNLTQINYNNQTSEGFFNNRIWGVEDVADYLRVSVGHIYNLTSKTSKRKIPHRKKGKLLYFFPSEIQDWINEGDLV